MLLGRLANWVGRHQIIMITDKTNSSVLHYEINFHPNISRTVGHFQFLRNTVLEPSQTVHSVSYCCRIISWVIRCAVFRIAVHNLFVCCPPLPRVYSRQFLQDIWCLLFPFAYHTLLMTSVAETSSFYILRYSWTKLHAHRAWTIFG